MHRTWILLVMLSPVVAGCAVCCSDDDYNYSAYGGIAERYDMRNGRVGSVFAPAGLSGAVPAGNYEVIENEELAPPEPDAIGL